MIRNNLKLVFIRTIFSIFIICLMTCAGKKIVKIPNPDLTKIHIINFQYTPYPTNSINGEFLNNTKYKIKKIILKFELVKYDKSNQLRIIYDLISKKLDVGDFYSFQSAMKDPERRRIFHGKVSENMNIGSLPNLEKTVKEFNSEELEIVLARRISFEVNILPEYSTNLQFKLEHNFTEDSFLNNINIVEAFGIIHNNSK